MSQQAFDLEAQKLEVAFAGGGLALLALREIAPPLAAAWARLQLREEHYAILPGLLIPNLIVDQPPCLKGFKILMDLEDGKLVLEPREVVDDYCEVALGDPAVLEALLCLLRQHACAGCQAEAACCAKIQDLGRNSP